MRRPLIAVLFAVFIAAAAYAHNGHIHNFLGTVKSVQGNNLTVVSTAAKEMHFVLTPKTAYQQDDKASSVDKLTPGTRVAVHVDEDGRTVTLVRIGKSQ